jgi:hypothetical protein
MTSRGAAGPAVPDLPPPPGVAVVRDRNSINETMRGLLLVTSFAAAVPLAGCYDSSALVNQVRSEALRSQTHEIDLGLYRTTLPSDPDTGRLSEIELQLFGTVPQYKIATIKKQLKADAPQLRYDTLIAIRETSAEELGEPDLGKLRNRLMQVANSVIKDAPIQAIGVEKIRIVNKR